MSQIKAYIPEIALEVGINASLVLQHIKYWMETKEVTKVYRTNKQISDDFKGSLSESQIQRAKKKLIEAGLIVVSHDKGHLRTTHFTLTEKAKGLLGLVKETVQKVVKAVKKAVKPKSMADNFKEEGTHKGQEIPHDIREKLGLNKKKEETLVPEPVFVDNEDDNGDEDYFAAIDFALNQVQEEQTKTLSLNEIMGQAFAQVPNVQQLEKNRAELEFARNFKEDF